MRQVSTGQIFFRRQENIRHLPDDPNGPDGPDWNVPEKFWKRIKTAVGKSATVLAPFSAAADMPKKWQYRKAW